MKANFLKYLFFLILFLFFGNNSFSYSGNLDNKDIDNKIEFSYILQSPSYIELQEEGIYQCDDEKEDCKVNFKLVNEEEKDISSKYECEIIVNFDIGTFKNNCNPTTIVIPRNSEQKIKFKVYEKDNIENFSEKEILIKNLSTPLSDNFDFKYLLQSPSYVRELSENNLECEAGESECKINFKFITLEEKDIPSKYLCEIITDFDIGEEKNKCNPNTIIIPDNSDKNIKIKISEKNNLENFIEKNIFVDNTITHYLPTNKIVVQGGKSKYKKILMSSMVCLTYSKCSINFTGGYSKSGVYYKWIFGNGEKFHGVNPKTVQFSPGFYLVKLIISDKYGNRKVEHYRVRVKQLLKKSEIEASKKNVQKILKIKKNVYLELNKKTKNLLKNEKYKNNVLLKNINKEFEIVDKYKSKIDKNIKYITDSGNTNKITKNISRKISKNITVKKIFGKGLKKKKIVKNKSKKKYINKVVNKEKNKLKNIKKQKKLLEKEKIKLLKKNIKLNISFQKKSLKISGKTFPKSRVNISIGKNTFSKISLANGKYTFKIKKLIAGKYKILATTYNKDGKIIAQKKSKEKIITQSYINKVKSYLYRKPKKHKKSRKKYIKKNKYKKFKISSYSNNYKNINKKNNIFNKNIFILNILVSIFGFILLYIILVRKKIL